MGMTVETKVVVVGNVSVGGRAPLALIAGPCVIEDEDTTLRAAEQLVGLAAELGIPLIFKSSYDKANRSSASSYRGPGLSKGLAILSDVKQRFECPVLSDVHEVEQVGPASEVLDVLQVPAFLCRQTDLLQAAARTGKPVNLKKGQFLAPWDMKNAIEKITEVGNTGILLTERGTCFGYNNLVSDMRALPLMRQFGYPVVFDATHSVQLPGGEGSQSGGQRELVPFLARAAVAAGCDALFLEVHESPDGARCDGPNMLALDSLPGLLREAMEIHEIVKDES